MKRTVPLLITAIVGAILVASRFIPVAESWGEATTVWFDVLAAIAFVLGGGSLLKLHLKKISDRAAGWGYSAITLVAFAATLFIGLGKTGAPPAQKLEFYGQSFVPLAVADFPESAVARIPGTIPPRADGEEPPLSVARQLREDNGQIVFRGWMTPQQQSELSDFKESLGWQCTVDKLFDAAQPPASVRGKVEMFPDHSALSFRGFMTDEQRDALLTLKGNERWTQAVEALYERSRKETRAVAPPLPDGFEIPASLKASVFRDETTHELAIRGPMSAAVRDALARANFPLVRPTTAEERAKLRSEIESRGATLNADQATTFDNLLRAAWSVEQLRIALDDAGKSVAIEKTACERAQAQNAGGRDAPAPQTSGPDGVLNERQKSVLSEFVADPAATVASLAERLKAAGPFTGAQAAALDAFFAKISTRGEQQLALCVELLRDGPLSRKQRDFLLLEYREQHQWRRAVGRLFTAAHVAKYPWSGQYNAQASVFGWLYEFVFKPLTATMFALLAFYVASAAFRAFRAKNLEAMFLLGTAFVILLGRTFAGYLLTSWIPENGPLALFRVENLTVFVMSVFTTAGNRAIMIGIALGLASTSLKVLLGIDRSYLGSRED